MTDHTISGHSTTKLHLARRLIKCCYLQTNLLHDVGSTVDQDVGTLNVSFHQSSQHFFTWQNQFKK